MNCRLNGCPLFQAEWLPAIPLPPAVVRYHGGEFYHEHYDNKAGADPTRDATIIIYLWWAANGWDGAGAVAQSFGMAHSPL